MKVKVVKKRPAPIEAEQVVKSFKGKYLEDVSPAVIAYALGMKSHEKLKDLRG